MDWIFDTNSLLAFGTLTVLEIVLGVDNVIFITILAGKVPEEERARARILGLALAMGTRLLLLFSLTWLMTLTGPIFTVLSHEISGRDLILLTGGLFLLGKSTVEIHDKLEGEEGRKSAKARVSFVSVLVQIALLDTVFSLDSVITAIGLADELIIMVAAIVVSVVFMMIFVGPVARFIDEHPTFKMLALSFLLLIGVALIGEGLGFHVPKGYIYFAMGFSAFVEVLNMRIRRRTERPVQLRKPITE